MTAEPESPVGTLWFAHWLRALSVATVVLLHMWVTLWANNDVASAFGHVRPIPDAAEVPWAGVFGWMPVHVGLGYVAVGFFFMISGLVIPLTMEGRTLGRFVATRIFRIYPVWIASTAVIALVFAVQAWSTNQAIGLSITDWITNVAIVPDLTGSVLINPVAWTLMVEVKFYLLCAVLWRTGALNRPSAVSALAALWAAYGIAAWGRLDGLHQTHPTAWTASQALAADAMHMCVALAGVCLYNRMRRGWTRSATAAAITVCAGAMTLSAWFVERAAGFAGAKFSGYAVALTLFTLAYVHREKFPRSRVAKVGADLSYTVYATHFVLGVVFAHWLINVTGSPALATTGAIAMVVALSIALHRWIELPGIRFGRRVRWPLASGATPSQTPR